MKKRLDKKNKKNLDENLFKILEKAKHLINNDEDLDESDYEQCSICLETIKNNDIVREINKCKHCFHIGCADKWFEEKITCPNCRQDIRIEIVN